MLFDLSSQLKHCLLRGFWASYALVPPPAVCSRPLEERGELDELDKIISCVPFMLAPPRITRAICGRGLLFLTFATNEFVLLSKHTYAALARKAVGRKELVADKKINK